jgi:hypothetical protein
MEFTETQLEALFQAKLLGEEGNGFVPVEEAASECDQLVDANWLQTSGPPRAAVRRFAPRSCPSALAGLQNGCNPARKPLWNAGKARTGGCRRRAARADPAASGGDG